MENGVLSIAGRGNGSDKLIKVPAAPKHLNADAKKGYNMMGGYLAKAERLKEMYLPTLEIWAVAYAQWVYAVNEINSLNKAEPGRGFIQRFPSGARNLAPEVTLRDNAADQMMKCAKLFGFDPKSEKELRETIETGQLDIFEEFNKANHS